MHRVWPGSDRQLKLNIPTSKCVPNLDFLFAFVSLTGKLVKLAIQKYFHIKVNPRDFSKNLSKNWVQGLLTLWFDRDFDQNKIWLQKFDWECDVKLLYE